MSKPTEQTPEEAKAAAGRFVAFVTTIRDYSTTVAEVFVESRKHNHFGPTVEAAVKGKF